MVVSGSSAYSTQTDDQTTLDGLRNSYAFVASRDGVLSNLSINMGFLFSGDNPVDQPVVFTWRILVGPKVAGSNDFSDSKIGFNLIVPSGTAADDKYHFFTASDSVNTYNISKGQRVVVDALITTDINGNASDLVNGFTLSGGYLFS
jgi:hypothetical protein